jgi:hypothetical protein
MYLKMPSVSGGISVGLVTGGEGQHFSVAYTHRYIVGGISILIYI